MCKLGRNNFYVVAFVHGNLQQQRRMYFVNDYLKSAVTRAAGKNDNFKPLD